MKGITEAVLERARARRTSARSHLGRKPLRQEPGFQINAYPKISTLETLFALGISPGEALDAIADVLNGEAQIEQFIAGWKRTAKHLDRAVNT